MQSSEEAAKIAKKGASHLILKKNYHLNLKKKEELCFVALALILVIGTRHLLLLLHFVLSKRLLYLTAATTASTNMNMNVQRLKEVAAKVAPFSTSLYLIALNSPSMLLVMLLKLLLKLLIAIFAISLGTAVYLSPFPHTILPRSISISLYLIAELALAALSAANAAPAAYSYKTIFVITIIINFNDIMYTIMLTTTLSIIGFYGARLILAGTLSIVDTLLRFVISNSIIDRLLLLLLLIMSHYWPYYVDSLITISKK